MPSFLEGRLAKELNKGFRKESLALVLHRQGQAQSGGLDEDGFAGAASPEQYNGRGFDDDFSAEFRMRYSIPVTDSLVNIFGASIKVEPVQDDYIYLRQSWFRVRAVRRDPAKALYMCQVYQSPAPPWL